MRIIAGTYRGKKLMSPTSSATRPTSDRARESLFNILDHYLRRQDKKWGDMVFADVFAGTGAVGVEAVSRGTKRVFFFENNKEALKSLHHNTNGLSNINLFEDALNPLYAKPPVDILFMDAPYGQGLWERALAVFNERGWIGPQTYIVIEIDKGEKSPAPDGFEELDRRSYGRNTFIFMKKKSLLSNK